MEKGLLPKAQKMNKKHSRRKWYRNVVRVLAAGVVFCTTYALILPALTLTAEPICGVPAHIHTEECWSQPAKSVLSCAVAEEEGVVVLHSHDESCYDDGVLVCPLEERVLHSHTDQCYGQPELVCQLEETTGHIHGEDCETQLVLTCTQEEAEPHTHGEICYSEKVLTCQAGHTHDDSCYAEPVCICDQEHTHEQSCYAPAELICTTQEHCHDDSCYSGGELICTLEENQGHLHSESCYSEQITCTMEESAGHIHTENCYAQQGSLICTVPELVEHTHEASCFDEAGNCICGKLQTVNHVHSEACFVQTRPELICQLEEHEHTDNCYPTEETQPSLEPGYLCSSGEHTHWEACYDENGELTCSIPEHTHVPACLGVESDTTADVESPTQWEAPIRSLVLTGSYPEDVLTVAQTQLGYTRSKTNCILKDGQLCYYSRYGEKFGDPYGDWNPLFVAFCLDYAQVKDYPVESQCDLWQKTLEEEGLFIPAAEGEPKAGDILFLSREKNGEAALAGIVTECSDRKMTVILADDEGVVATREYSLSDQSVVGYGKLPFGKRVLTYAGEDFTVTVSFDDAAQIGENAVLRVREILPGTDEYETYYQQSLQALTEQADTVNREVAFVRFFDIHFEEDGEKVEPASAVDVQICYAESMADRTDAESVAVHFAQDGVEVLDAQLTQTDQEADTFRFTQDSFSVSGTMLLAAGQMNTATIVTGEPSGSSQYILIATYQNKYYAVYSKTDDKKAYGTAVTVSGNTVTWSGGDEMLWTVTATDQDSAYLIQNGATKRYIHPFHSSDRDYGATTAGAYASTLDYSAGSGSSFTIKGNGRYLAYSSLRNGLTLNQVLNQSDALTFQLAKVAQSEYYVWLDGTNGDLMAYYGSDDTCYSVAADDTFTLPTTWKSPTKYDYKINGWYDIKANTYHKPGDIVSVTQNTVYYADWVPVTYNYGRNNGNVVNALDTSDFISIDMFDYNTIFNMPSVTHTGTVSGSNHSEKWTLSGGLGFIFRDWDSGGNDISYPSNLNTANDNRDVITSGIVGNVGAGESSSSIISALFTKSDTPGRQYVGPANYLFQREEDPSSELYGFYYYDSEKNAASYSQSDGRFYVYDYQERTTDTTAGINDADFLPYNSPYVTYNGKSAQKDSYGMYYYDAKDSPQSDRPENNKDYIITNYNFGMKCVIDFYLPYDVGEKMYDDYYGNLDINGKHMLFSFSGDDDVWVFVDGKLVLDIGGVHGVEEGSIDFATGIVMAEGQQTANLVGTVKEGNHSMTVYYLERGSSQSNCTISFNLTPRFGLKMKKQEYVAGDPVDGVVFSAYMDEACTVPAELWHSAQEANSGAATTNSFEVENGELYLYGLVVGKTYYFVEDRELTPQAVQNKYVLSDDIIRLTLQDVNLDAERIEILPGPDSILSDGFEVLDQNIDNSDNTVSVTITNLRRPIEDQGVALPATGGIGTEGFAVFGCMLIAAAALLYSCMTGRKKRRTDTA